MPRPEYVLEDQLIAPGRVLLQRFDFQVFIEDDLQGQAAYLGFASGFLLYLKRIDAIGDTH